MKNLKDIILEKLIINKNTKIDKYHYHPKDKKELKKLLDKLIKERGCEGNFNDIDTSNITDMSMLFTFSHPKFNGDISEWDVSNVEDMYDMFYGCNDFNCNLNKWNVNKVKDMRDMFYGCPLEKNPPKWYKK